jgi:hypothetical protein
MIKKIVLGLVIFLLLSLSMDIFEESNLIEGFRNNRRGRGGRRGARAGGARGGRGRGARAGGGRAGGGRRGGRHHGHGRPYRPHRRHGRHSRRSYWLRGPRTRLYDTDGYYWGGWRQIPYLRLYDYFPSWFYTARCRAGCAYTGNGTVGCVNPTNSPDSCIFASDCYGC